LLIASGDTAYLSELDPSNTDLSEILQNGSGSAYFHAYLAREIGREDLFVPLMEVEWSRSERVWRLIAGEELCGYYIEAKRYADAEILAADLVDAEDTVRNRRLYIEALYWQERDEEVLEEIAKLDHRAAETASDQTDLELALFKAVSSARLSQGSSGGIAGAGWKQLFLDLFLEQKPSSLHYRAIRFIENGYLQAFNDEETEFFYAIVAVADRRYADAVPVLGRLIDEKPVFFLTDATIYAAYMAFRFGGFASAGVELFARLVGREENRSTKKEFYSLCEKTALLNYAKGDFKTAAEYFETALDLAAVEHEQERMRWYFLRATLSWSLGRALDIIPSIINDYADPSYYSDLFNIVLTRLVHFGRWDDLLDFYTLEGELVGPGIRARSAYVSSAAIREEYVSAERSAEIVMGNAILNGGRYYDLLASAALGVLPETLSTVESSSEYLEESTIQDVIISGFLSYGLLGTAYERVRDDPDAVSDHTLLQLARAFRETGDFYSSIRLMDIFKARDPFLRTREVLELLYPRAFHDEIEAAAERDGIPPYLLFALVREESYFNPDIVSHAGAVGLSQLMPPTAAETADRMGIDLPPLTDPGSNISIGSFYFARMLERFGIPSNAVFAYNAGPGRMASWRRIYAHLPEDLLLEAVPIEETQNHGRKVFASAAIYGYLYYGVPPAETAVYFFSSDRKGQ
jgi:soluble lytic murein transglycosylase